MKKILFAILSIVLLFSCKSTKYIEVPVDNIKIEYRDRLLIDTIIKNDSTIIKLNGDTVYIEKYKYLFKIRESRDTINITDTTTIIKPVETVREVNRLYNWQIILMILGGVATAYILYRIIRFIKQWILE